MVQFSPEVARKYFFKIKESSLIATGTSLLYDCQFVWVAYWRETLRNVKVSIYLIHIRESFLITIDIKKTRIIIKIYHGCEDGIEKFILRITDWLNKAYRVMTNGDPKGWILLSNPHTNDGYFLLSNKLRNFLI